MNKIIYVIPASRYLSKEPESLQSEFKILFWLSILIDTGSPHPVQDRQDNRAMFLKFTTPK